MSTDWEQLYQEGVKPWDKGRPAPSLMTWMLRNPSALTGQILVPGCGLGHDVREIAECNPGTKVTGIDISPSALVGANQFTTPQNCHFKEWDLFALPESALGSFDWVWEHTCFCAIDQDRRDDYVKAVHAALKPNGEILGVFYLDPYDEEHQPGGGPPHGTSLEELTDRFVGSGYFEITEQYVPEITYPGREEKELILRMNSVLQGRD